MKPNKIFSVMDLARRARKNGDVFNPLFVGPPGVGKTEIVQQWAQLKNLRTIVMTLSSYDPPDFKGYPNIQVVGGRSRMDFATPLMWPDDGEGVIILEEMNRAPTSIMQCLLSLGDSRRGFDGYKLPEGWLVVGCVNPENNEYDTTTMDPALKDRFEMFQVSYDKLSFVSYIQKAGWNKEIVNFVDSGQWSYVPPESIGNTPGAKYISPRTFSKLNAIMKAGFDREDELMLFETELGSNVAKDFYNFRHNESPVMYNDLINNLELSLVKLKKFSDPNDYKNGMVSLTVKDLVETNQITDEMLVEVVNVIPADQASVLIRDLGFKRKVDVPTLISSLCKTYPKVKNKFKSLKMD
jgi:hypothetical protein